MGTGPLRYCIYSIYCIYNIIYLFIYVFVYLFTLWLFNIAMGNGPFIDGLPIKNGDLPWLC